MNVLYHSGIFSISLRPAFVCSQHISCDLVVDLEEELYAEMVMTYCSARIPNYILDIRVTLLVSSLNFIFKFARDLNVLLSVSPRYLCLSLRGNTFSYSLPVMSCITYCLSCRCALCTVQTDFIVFLLYTQYLNRTFRNTCHLMIWAFHVVCFCHFVSVHLTFALSGVLELRFWFCTERSCCCIDVYCFVGHCLCFGQ